MKTNGSTGGYTLVELLVGLVLGSVVLVGLTQIFLSSKRSYDTLTSQQDLQQSGQFALQFIAREIRQAGFTPQPWERQPLAAVTEDSADLGSSGDRLGIRYFSDRNCYGSPNPALDEQGAPAWYVKTVRFGLREEQRELAWFCSFGPPGGSAVVQVNNQGLVTGIDALQVLYGEDSDTDGQPDRWVNAGGWDDPGNIAAISFALLVSGRTAGDIRPGDPYALLDHTAGPFEDAAAREVVQTTVALRNYRP